jgi:hypothetical protein
LNCDAVGLKDLSHRLQSGRYKLGRTAASPMEPVPHTNMYVWFLRSLSRRLGWPQSSVGAGVEFEIESFDWSTRSPTPTDYPSRAAGVGEIFPADGNFRWRNAIFPTGWKF